MKGKGRSGWLIFRLGTVRAVKHVRTLNAEIKRASTMTEEELYTYAKVSLDIPFRKRSWYRGLLLPARRW
jgi:pyridoxal biosynthesis lyase PdxS